MKKNQRDTCTINLTKAINLDLTHRERAGQAVLLDPGKERDWWVGLAVPPGWTCSKAFPGQQSGASSPGEWWAWSWSPGHCGHWPVVASLFHLERLKSGLLPLESSSLQTSRMASWESCPH